MSQTYRAPKVKIPWHLVEERPDVLDTVTRMYLAVEEYVKRLLKELTGQEEPRLTAEELDRLLTLDRRELAHGIIEETFHKYGLKKYLAEWAKFLWRDVVFHRAVPLYAQLRVKDERDVGKAVKLKKGNIAWIRKRLEEGAKSKLAFLGVEVKRSKKESTYGKLYIALVFAREATPVELKAIVTVDINRLDYGIIVGLLVEGKLRQTLRLPDASVTRESGETSRGDK
ncbi:hypothetical protein Pisl_0606 [Pyrobaculum islandicum DSM 4184]|uniref:Uncharacterized protein n=1 Tax=Pyrobaculum islandicum (strain DSM 4184 / JCM 9189 / GEO3) TaxID=384616 RepID=A1RS52_PYRIL|nr:hypothetical protein Pisl_0606 [Pyrobaculum islandicum DSM 4184]